MFGGVGGHLVVPAGGEARDPDRDRGTLLGMRRAAGTGIY